jgi:pyruvate/2-oxoglutarate/acetoin dehydrogenase E1 component
VERNFSGNDRLLLLGEAVAALGGSGGSTRGLAAALPGRVLDLPAADRAMLGYALGLALSGRHPIVELTGTARLLAGLEVLAEAGAIHLAGEHAVPLIVRVPTGGEAGPRVDVACLDALASIAGLTVLAPVDPGGVLAAMEHAQALDAPVVILEPRRFWDELVSPGAPDLAREGEHALVVTWGTGLGSCLSAASALAEEGLEIGVYLLSTLSPLDVTRLGAAVAARGRLVIAEPEEGGPTSRVLAAVVDHAFLSYEAPPAVVPADPARIASAVREAVFY